MKFMVIAVLLMNSADVSATTTTMVKIINQETPLPLLPTKTLSTICMALTEPRTMFQNPLLAITGHTTLILQYASNRSIVTAGLTGKKNISKNCVADNFLVNNNCEYHLSPPTPVTVHPKNCAHIGKKKLEMVSGEIYKTLSPEFQGRYNMLTWNCVNWALKTWNSLGLPVKIGFPWFAPIPRFL